MCSWSDFMANKSLSIRIDETMLHKLHVVADYEGRSANSQILILIRDCIKDYEEKHGTIAIDGWKPDGWLRGSPIRFISVFMDPAIQRLPLRGAVSEADWEVNIVHYRFRLSAFVSLKYLPSSRGGPVWPPGKFEIFGNSEVFCRF